MTTINDEFESRSMLSEDKYFEIASDFYRRHPHVKTTTQINQYFDTDDLFLTNNNIVLRIRKTNKGAVLTLKIGIDGDSHAREISQKLSYFQHKALVEKSHFPKGAIKLELMSRGLSLYSIKYICDLKTKRMQIDELDYNYCVDQNEYKGIKDYNIEVEAKTVSESRKILEDLAKEYNFEISKDYIVKSKRVILKK